MKMRNDNEKMSFEEWARLLIYRKVPGSCRYLVNSEVVSRGAAILKCGDAFEVRIRERSEGTEKKQIVVDPFPPLRSARIEHRRVPCR